MAPTLKEIITATFDNNKNLEIANQAFENETILTQDLSMAVFLNVQFSKVKFENINFSGSYFDDCKFENCTFKKTVMRKSEFIDCNFRDCNLINSRFSKVDFYNSLFVDCQFCRINLGWSYWVNCIVRKTRFEQIDFEGAIFSNLKVKDLIVLNLNFTETFPAKFYKSNSNEFIELKSQSNFEKILKDINLIISTDQDETPNS